MTEPGTAATDAELADYYDQHRDHPGWGEPQPAAKPQRLDVTISVRFAPAEIATIRTRAEAGASKPKPGPQTHRLHPSVRPQRRAATDRPDTTLAHRRSTLP